MKAIHELNKIAAENIILIMDLKYLIKKERVKRKNSHSNTKNPNQWKTTY